MSNDTLKELSQAGWPLERLDEAVLSLVRSLGVKIKPGAFAAPRHDGPDDTIITQWLEAALFQSGAEAVNVTTSYNNVSKLIQATGPALVRLPGKPRRFIALWGHRNKIKVITPHNNICKFKIKTIKTALTDELEAPLRASIEQLLDESRVPTERQENARQAILEEQLGSTRIQGYWIFSISPMASFLDQIRHARLYRHGAAIITASFMGQALAILAWWVIGRGALEGHFDQTLVAAWALLLFSAAPFLLLASWGQNLLALDLGSLFKQRLLYGILKLEPEEIRHQGAGQFLGTVMESEALEAMALGRGLTIVTAAVQLCLALVVLAAGVGGWFHAALLMGWIIFALVVCWFYYRYAKIWVNA